MINNIKYINKSDFAEFSQISNNIDWEWLSSNITNAQTDYVDRILSQPLANELKRLIYIQKIQPLITASCSNNVLTVTANVGGSIQVGDEIISIAKIKAEKELEKLLEIQTPNQKDLDRIAVLEAEILTYVKNNSFIVSGSGPYTIEIEGNESYLQTFASQELQLINDNMRLLQYVKQITVLRTLYVCIPFLWAKVNNQGINTATSDKINAITKTDVEWLIANIENTAQLRESSLVAFLENNQTKYPLYVPLEAKNCNKVQKNHGIIFY